MSKQHLPHGKVVDRSSGFVLKALGETCYERTLYIVLDTFRPTELHEKILEQHRDYRPSLHRVFVAKAEANYRQDRENKGGTKGALCLEFDITAINKGKRMLQALAKKYNDSKPQEPSE